MEYLVYLISAGLSLIAICISGATFWLTLVKKGRLICLRPLSFNIRSVSYETDATYQILLRQLFIATTGPRLFFIEQLYLELRKNTSRQQFNIWVYCKKNDLVRASGIKIGHDDVNADHYFLLPKDVSDYAFVAGSYKLELFAKVWGREDPVLLTECEFAIDKKQSVALNNREQSLNFDWTNNERDYT
ncbi:hypothetical protein N8860_05715 [Alphaproteobacteria bacterium]|nr:hypothetical protein [Alphaproteobacteria bacterium]